MESNNNDSNFLSNKPSAKSPIKYTSGFEQFVRKEGLPYVQKYRPWILNDPNYCNMRVDDEIRDLMEQQWSKLPQSQKEKYIIAADMINRKKAARLQYGHLENEEEEEEDSPSQQSSPKKVATPKKQEISIPFTKKNPTPTSVASKKKKPISDWDAESSSSSSKFDIQNNRTIVVYKNPVETSTALMNLNGLDDDEDSFLNKKPSAAAIAEAENLAHEYFLESNKELKLNDDGEYDEDDDDEDDGNEEYKNEVEDEDDEDDEDTYNLPTDEQVRKKLANELSKQERRRRMFARARIPLRDALREEMYNKGILWKGGNESIL